MAKGKVGRQCHICGYKTKPMTDEHTPPQSAGNQGWTHVHTLNGLLRVAGSQLLPPLQEGRNGVFRRTLCTDCNQLTGEWYNLSFKEFTEQARQHIKTTVGQEWVSVVFRQIEPLKVIKQIAVTALAVAEYDNCPQAEVMKDFVLNRYANGVLNGVQICTYMNPPREGEESDKQLSTKRLCSQCVVMDAEQHTEFRCFAEVGHNPLGYITHFPQLKPLTREIVELTDVTLFSQFHWNQKVDLNVRFAVRNPFGPVPSRFANVVGGGTWDIASAKVV